MLAMLWPTAWEAEPLASPISGNNQAFTSRCAVGAVGLFGMLQQQ